MKELSYREEEAASQRYKQDYVNGFETLITAWERDAEAARDAYAKTVFSEAGAARRDLYAMLGKPLGMPRGEPPIPSVEELSREDDVTVTRMHFEVLDGLTLTGLLIRHENDERLPLVICQHGGLGTPETVAGIHRGDTANYYHMAMRTFDKGVNVFLPQLLLWNTGVFGAPYNRVQTDARLKRLGSSVAAVEIHGIMRILDYFETQPFVKNFGMVGLSYGGFYTLYTAACDTRICSAVSSSFFNDRSKIPWADLTWQNSAYRFFDAETACLVYPRHLSVLVGENDELFNVEGARREYIRLEKLCASVGTAWVDFTVFKGNHMFPKEDAALDALVKDLLA